MPILLVFVGGCVGAVGRFAADRIISARHDMVFPWGTFAVNVVGSAVLGLLVGGVQAHSSWLVLLAGTGFCGALTTFSTFSLETFRMLEERSVFEAGLNVFASVVVGLACVIGGFALGQAIF
ncbi:MAG: fluoride efflux transporter CrcB [Actinomycetota bacterium]|nr:fluoride efflux transporter CrcB [Actinomycetota bacterium]